MPLRPNPKARGTAPVHAVGGAARDSALHASYPEKSSSSAPRLVPPTKPYQSWGLSPAGTPNGRKASRSPAREGPQPSPPLRLKPQTAAGKGGGSRTFRRAVFGGPQHAVHFEQLR